MTHLLEDLLDILEAARISYMVVGSVSASLYGQSRQTQDLDLVVDLRLEDLKKLQALLPENRYYVSWEAAQEAILRRGQFNIIDIGNGGKIDLMLLKPRPFSQSEFERRRWVDLGLRKVCLAGPEDVILAKLEWNQISPSERQLRDVLGILQLQAEQLDWDYLRKWAIELGVTETLNRLATDTH